MKNPLLRLLLISLVLCLLFTGYFPASGQSGGTFVISDINCEAFPEITLDLRALDADGNFITSGLASDSLSVFENGEAVEGIRLRDPVPGPKYVIFSLDLGTSSNLDDFQGEIQNMMREFANSFQDGTDTVAIYLNLPRDSGQFPSPALDPTQEKDQLSAAIEALDLRNPTNQSLEEGWKSLNDAYDRLLNMTGGNPERYGSAIIYISRFIENHPDQARVDAPDLGSLMADQGVKVYILQTEENGQFTAPFVEFDTWNKGGYVLFSDEADRQTKLDDMYQEIARNSQVYKVQFRSKTGDTTHKISVVPAGADSSDPNLTRDCDIELQDPPVTITSPTGVNALDPLKLGEFLHVEAAIAEEWPDGYPRNIVTATLFVEGDEYTIQPESSKLPFQFDVDVSKYTSGDVISLRVQVIDELGKEGVSNSVMVRLQFSLPTPTPDPVAGGSGTDRVRLESCQNPLSLQCAGDWLQGNWYLLALSAGFIVLLILLITTRRQLAGLSAPAVQAFSKGVEHLKTMIGGTSHRREVLAYLHVLIPRADRTGSKIDIYQNRTTLGRDKSVTDVQLYLLDDNTSVSGLHCTIYFDQGKFSIIDENSTNGTQVNGNRLVPNEPYELSTGDEIVLGDIYRQGAKLKFEIAPEFLQRQGAAVIEEDFNIDLDAPQEVEEEPAFPSTPEPPKKKGDFSETVPGYREEDTQIEREEYFSPNTSEQPQPRSKKGKDKWLDDLG